VRLKNARVDSVAYVDKPSIKIPFQVVRKHADGGYEFRCFTPFTKSENGTDGSVVVSGCAYPAFGASGPRASQGDFATVEDVAHMRDTHAERGIMNYMHQRDLSKDQARVLKSEITPAGHCNLTSEVRDPEIAQQIRDKKLTGYSIQGFCPATKSDETADEPELALTKSEADEIEATLEVTRNIAQLIEIINLLPCGEPVDDGPSLEQQDAIVARAIQRQRANDFAVAQHDAQIKEGNLQNKRAARELANYQWIAHQERIMAEEEAHLNRQREIERHGF